MTQSQKFGWPGAAALRWAAAPLLAFFAAGAAARYLLPAEQVAVAAPAQQLVAASLQQLAAGDRRGAVDGLVRAGRMAPGEGATQTVLIGKLQAMGEYVAAAEAIERLLRAAPLEQQTTASYAGFCEHLLEHGDLDGARRILASDLQERWPDAAETSYLRGRMALAAAVAPAEVESAARQLERCVAMLPDHASSRLQLAIACRRLCQPERAEVLLREARALRPFDPAVLLQLGEVLRERGAAVAATQVLEEHERLRGLRARREQLQAKRTLGTMEAAEHLELGQLLAALGEPAKAARLLRAYSRQHAADAAGQRELAAAYARVGDAAAAAAASAAADAIEAARRP